MKRYVSKHIFSVQVSSQTPAPSEAWVRVTAAEAGFMELWLKSAIQANPQLVMAPYLVSEDSDEEWRFWAKEFRTPAGPIDLLLVSDTGRVAVVETKLSYNPGIRRSVVAQVLDYAAHLQDMAIGEFPELPTGSDGHPFATREDVAECIENGDLLLVIASDQLDPRAVRLGAALQSEHLTRGWELILVEIGVFAHVPSDNSSDHLLVPHLRGVVEPSERQVVRVRLEGDRAKISVEHISAGSDRANPDLLAAVEAYNQAAPPEMRAVGTAKSYRQILTPGWPSIVHYEFYRRPDGALFADLHLESRKLGPVAESVKQRLPELQASLANVQWDDEWQKSKWRVSVPIPPDAGPSDTAKAMQELIRLTRDHVQSALKESGFLEA